MESQQRNAGKPIFIQFAQELAARIEAPGNIRLVRDRAQPSGFPQNKGWIRLEVDDGRGTGAKIYVPQTKTVIGRLHTTLDLVPDLHAGILPLPQPANGKPYENGLIRSHLVPNVELAAAVFIEAVAGGGAVRPTRRIPMPKQQRQQIQVIDRQPIEAVHRQTDTDERAALIDSLRDRMA